MSEQFCFRFLIFDKLGTLIWKTGSSLLGGFLFFLWQGSWCTLLLLEYFLGLHNFCVGLLCEQPHPPESFFPSGFSDIPERSSAKGASCTDQWIGFMQEKMDGNKSTRSIFFNVLIYHTLFAHVHKLLYSKITPVAFLWLKSFGQLKYPDVGIRNHRLRRIFYFDIQNSWYKYIFHL